MYCIGFNGPPRSGKDTIANYLADELRLPSVVRALSMPLRLTAFAMLGIPYTLSAYESIKDVPQQALGGDSIRQFMIAFSERFIKQRYGHGQWGRSVLGSLPWDVRMPGVLLVSDIGFQDEVAIFEQAFGPDHSLTVQLTREGKTWGNDSRGYVGGEHVLELNNESVRKCSDQIIDHCKDKLGWSL